MVAAAALLGAMGCAAAGRAWAQGRRPRRLGLLATWGPEVTGVAPYWQAMFGELERRGWVAGAELEVVARYNRGNPARDAALAVELLAQAPEVVVATTSGAVQALRQTNASVPVVMVNVSHAVEAGFVASLARPGGHVTGVVNQAGDMQGKFIELLRTVRPGLQRIGAVWTPSNRGSALAFDDMAATAAAAGLTLTSLPLESPGDVDAVLAKADREGVQALHLHPPPAVTAGRAPILAWAIERRVATLGHPAWVREGCLMSYWADIAELYRVAGGQVDRILRGAKPADLPVQQPTGFELRVNLKTARAIGVQVPRSLLVQAIEVIE